MRQNSTYGTASSKKTETMLKTILQLLTFRISKIEIESFEKQHFMAGLIGTWIVGMGRYWDDPGAHLGQHLGLGSVVYIFVLALLIWLVILPFRVKGWNYFTVLTFISLTSFPAILYAIPIERFVDIETAASVNAWFLAVVAAWRLGLLFYFLKKFTELSTTYIALGTLLPMTGIIAMLTYLNLERAVFNIMGGIRNSTSADAAYQILVTLTMLSTFAFIPLLVAYLAAIYTRRNQ